MNNSKIVAINGRFLARRQTGQERFASEVVKNIDLICKKGEIELIVPNEVEEDIQFNNIQVIKYGNRKSHLWEQTDYYVYCKRNKRLSLNLCTIQPLLRPGIVCIHDISYKINPEFFKSKYGKLSAIWHKLNYYVAMKKSPVIFTVTENSKKEIISTYGIEQNRIVVVPNGWEHIKRIQPDETIFDRISEIEKGKYFITIGSLAPNKNINWVIENAKVNSTEKYVLVGKASLKEYGCDFHTSPSNIILTGYLSDPELVALLSNAKALIFPSIYEGFGIPPLEALALGVPAIVANCSCMPSIFGDAVYYLDPYQPNVNINKIMESKITDAKNVLDHNTYANAASIIYKTLKDKQFVI